jgi:hypothetical protein
VVKFLFDDESLSCETLRTAGFALDGGADLGELLVTASAIGHRDHPPAEEHGMAARLTDVTVACEGSGAFREGVWVSVSDVALLSSLSS